MTVVIRGPMIAYIEFMQYWLPYGHGDEVLQSLRNRLNAYYVELQREKEK